VVLLPDDDPDLTGRLTVLCEASARPARVVAEVPELTSRAEALAAELPDKTGEPGDGEAVIALVPAVPERWPVGVGAASRRAAGRDEAGRALGRRHEELAAAAAALPAPATVIAVLVVP
ncbi:hypothetical protein ACFQ3T_34560, partial [Saccharothrix hoggarensis]